LTGTGPVSFEPTLALDGGGDGLKKIFELCRQLNGKLRPRGSLLLEIGQGQAEAVVACLRDLFPSALIEIALDLSGIERVVSLSLTHDCHDAKLDWVSPEFKPEL